MLNDFCSIDLRKYPKEFVGLLRGWNKISMDSWKDNYGGVGYGNFLLDYAGFNLDNYILKLSKIPKYFNDGYTNQVLKSIVDYTISFIEESPGNLVLNIDWSRIKDHKLRQLIYELYLMIRKHFRRNSNSVDDFVFKNFEMNNFNNEFVVEENGYKKYRISFDLKFNFAYDSEHKLIEGYKYLNAPVGFIFDGNVEYEEDFINRYGNGFVKYRISVWLPNEGNYYYSISIPYSADQRILVYEQTG